MPGSGCLHTPRCAVTLALGWLTSLHGEEAIAEHLWKVGLSFPPALLTLLVNNYSVTAPSGGGGRGGREGA